MAGLTTFDDVYERFMITNGYDEFDLPQTQDGIYLLIDSAKDIFNEKLEENIELDFDTETFSIEMNGSQKMLFSNCLKLICAIKNLEEFTSTYSMFKNEIGLKDYNAQVSARQDIINRHEKKIDDSVFRMMMFDE